MGSYSTEELTEALCTIDSIIQKCKKAQDKFLDGEPQHTLLKNQLKAMYISKALITKELSKMNPLTESKSSYNYNCNPELLLSNLNRIHTTDLGEERIKKNLRLDTDDVVGWCKERIKSQGARITRRGKNWYIDVAGCEITVNAYSYTIITAHRL